MTKPTVFILALIGLLVGVGSYVMTRPGPVDRPVGAVAGPTDTFACKTTNGVETCSDTRSFNQASTTICSIKSPSATSTLTFASRDIITGTTTALFWEMAKSASPSATTTSLGMETVASAAKTTMLASTTPNDVYASRLVFGPNTYFNVKYGGALGSLNSMTGNCKATFILN